jgi:hypothetical protein
MEPVRQSTRCHPKSMYPTVGFISMNIYWDWYNFARLGFKL